MEPLLATYWPVILIAIIVGIIVGWLVFGRTQTVRLEQDDRPVRPHMASSHEGHSVADEAAEAAAEFAGIALQADVVEQLPSASGEADDLERLKGVGPKMAAMLGGAGLVSYSQIARLTPAQVSAIDESLGAFKGRLTRDRIVEQADYLSRGDTEGYEARFGKLDG